MSTVMWGPNEEEWKKRVDLFRALTGDDIKDMTLPTKNRLREYPEIRSGEDLAQLLNALRADDRHLEQLKKDTTAEDFEGPS